MAGNPARPRNARLAAIHSLYRYMALRHPEHLQTIGRVIAIPFKRHEQNSVSYLNLDEIKALLRAPDRTTWLGRRDHALLLTAIQTGVRVTELVTLRICDVSLGTGAHCRVTGKGRKKRTATLTRETVAVLRQWLKERQGEPEEPLFPTRQGRPLTRSGVGQLLAKHAATAAIGCASLKTKDVSPHTYADLGVMPTRRGGDPANRGITCRRDQHNHGDWRGSLDQRCERATGQPAETVFAERGALSTLQHHA